MTASVLDRAPSDDSPDPVGESTDETTAPPPPRAVPAALVRWRDPKPWVGWVVAAGLAVISGFTRFWGLGFPNTRIFDEAYYPVEAQEMLRYGYEDNRGYLFIVHPPLGKWLIGWSTDLFGNGLNSAFGWRVFPAIFGSLTVIMVARTARRMFRSNLFGATAGLLMAFEGLSLVLARTAILDIFLQFFVFAAFACLVLDRDQLRGRLGGLISDGVELSRGLPSLGPRPWRLLGGVMIGLALAIKWSALSFFVLFVIMSLLWDRGAFKAAGVRRPARALARRSLLPAAGSLFLVPLGSYLMTYLGWFVGENGYNRHWAETHGPSTHLDAFGLHIPFSWSWVPDPIRALGDSTLNAYRFHEGLTSPHSYGSNPWSWLVLGRPVDFYYSGDDKTCGASACSREVLLIGTPLLWWAFVPMLLWLAWHYATTRDWRAAAVWVAFLAGYAVWFQNLDRTMFLFYMAPLVPFLVLGLTLALGTMLGALLAFSGGAERIADTVLDRVGTQRVPWAMALVAMIVGIPLFFEIGVVLLIPIIFTVAKRVETSGMSHGNAYLLTGIPALAGLSVLHGLVPPHPGPLTAIETIHADLGTTILYGLIVAVPTVIIAGPLFARFATHWAHADPPQDLIDKVTNETEVENPPGFGITMATILLPVALMLLRTLADVSLDEKDKFREWADFIGNPIVALLLAVGLAMWTFGLSRGMDRAKVQKLMGDSLAPAAAILVIIGAGGGFKGVLVGAGIGDAIAEGVKSAGLSPLLLAWLLAVLIRLATGSATVATVTAAGIIAPVVAHDPSVNTSLVVLAVGTGSLFFSHVNDAGFWLINQYFGMSVKDTIKTWSVMETIISVVGMAFVMLLSVVV